MAAQMQAGCLPSDPCWHELAPKVSCASPGLPPLLMFVAAGRHNATLLFQLLGDGADVVRLIATAATNVPHAHVVVVPCPFLYVPTCGHAGLQGKGELGQVNETLLRGVRHVIDDRLHHQEHVLGDAQSQGLHSELHLVDSICELIGPEVAVQPYDLCASPCQDLRTLSSAHPMHVPFLADAHVHSDLFLGHLLLAYLHSPLCFLHVLKVLGNHEV